MYYYKIIKTESLDKFSLEGPLMGIHELVTKDHTSWDSSFIKYVQLSKGEVIATFLPNEVLAVTYKL